MKKYILILMITLPFRMTFGQVTSDRFELGSTLVTINSFNDDHLYFRERPAVEYMNGLFFRYSLKRIAVRAQIAYSENYQYYSNPPSPDAASGDCYNKEVRFGLGGQFSFFKNNEFLYSFVDALYRNVFSIGHMYGGIAGANNSYASTTNGFQMNIGLGSRINIYKSISVSPEIGYSYFDGNVKETGAFIPSATSTTNNRRTGYHSPFAKLNFTIRF